MAAAMFLLRDWILTTVLHGHGESAEVASKFIAISIPANVPLAVGMTFAGVLRAVGDARRAMYVTLSAGIATAFSALGSECTAPPGRRSSLV
jgi:Na+-driven multidrug efflux pump